jgi:hypothetical protein
VTALHHLATASPYIAALVVLLVLASIGVLILACLPERNRDSDIERQIQSLRRHADHAVQTRPRVRANGCASTPGHLKAAPKADKPKACGGGMCHHRADCSDTYCPGRISASLAGTQEHRHARH